MRYYKLFRKYVGGVGWSEVDPFSLTVQSKTTGDVVVESLSSTKITTYYANGHYYVSLDIAEYTLNTDYKLIWTFEIVEGQEQTIMEYFKLSVVGEEVALVVRPIGGRLNKALSRFGDTLLVVKDEGSTVILGKSWASKRITDYWFQQYIRNVMFVNTPEVFGGNLIRDIKRDQYHFIYNMHKIILKEDIMEQKGTLLYINKSCEIQRLNGTAGSMGGTVQTFVSQKTGIRAHLRIVSRDLRIEKPALLETASCLLYLQNDTNVLVLDRIIIDSVNYQVDSIDKITLSGLYELELSLDKR